MKRLTLNKTWKLCLAMWKWIAGQIKKDDTLNVVGLKDKWLEKHGYAPDKILATCFFCDWAGDDDFSTCNCPAKKIDPKFRCNCKTYDYSNHPIAFYNKLVSLNRKRLK